MRPRGNNVEIGHGFGSGFPLGANAPFGAAAFAHVAVDAAVEADLVGSVNVDGKAVERKQFGIVKGEDSFDDDVAAGRNGGGGIGDAAVGSEVVDWALNGLAAGEAADVLDEELGFQ